MVYRGLPWFTMVYHGIPWYTVYHTMVNHGTHHGIPGKPR